MTLGVCYTKALARSMATTKQIKAADILNNAFTTSLVETQTLCATDHPTLGGPDLANEQQLQQTFEASLNSSDTAAFTDERPEDRSSGH